MASKRNIRRRSCERKHKYYDLPSALHAAHTLERMGSSWLMAYKCKFCGCFHVGHADRHIKQTVLARAEAHGPE